jgi:hypothetical protein
VSRKKSIVSNKSVLVFASLLLFLVAGLIYYHSPLSVHALPPDPCFGQHNAFCLDQYCKNDPERLKATCCWKFADTGQSVCQDCDINTDTGEFENCTTAGRKGVSLPPLIQACPENTALDANGNCAPVIKNPPSTDQGTTTTPQPPPSSNDNKHLKHKGELSQSGEELTAQKRNNNKDNSPTPPACPTDNSPIPPNCTLKPKF